MKNRDMVEEPLRQLEKLLYCLEEIQTRVNAALAVWPEIGRTLKPATVKLDEVIASLYELKKSLSDLWDRGFQAKWK